MDVAVPLTTLLMVEMVYDVCESPSHGPRLGQYFTVYKCISKPLSIFRHGLIGTKVSTRMPHYLRSLSRAKRAKLSIQNVIFYMCVTKEGAKEKLEENTKFFINSLNMYTGHLTFLKLCFSTSHPCTPLLCRYTATFSLFPWLFFISLVHSFSL